MGGTHLWPSHHSPTCAPPPALTTLLPPPAQGTFPLQGLKVLEATCYQAPASREGWCGAHRAGSYKPGRDEDLPMGPLLFWSREGLAEGSQSVSMLPALQGAGLRAGPSASSPPGHGLLG